MAISLEELGFQRSLSSFISAKGNSRRIARGGFQIYTRKEMSIESTKNMIKYERLDGCARKSTRRRRKVTIDELWEEYFRLSRQAHEAFELVQRRLAKETMAVDAIQAAGLA
jgi:hypothetical protein